MIEFVLLGVALVGCLIAGIVDLKTTEVPDWVPYTMGAVGIIGNLIQSFLIGSWSPIILSLAVGTGYLGFGFLLYYLGQWGGGDAKILSAVGFLIPTLSFGKDLFLPFYFGFLFNVFFVGAIYMIIYILVLSLINRKIWDHFLKSLKSIPKKIFLQATLGVLVTIGIFSYITVYGLGVFDLYFSIKFGMFVSILVVSAALLWKFAKTVEEVGFKRKIPVSELKVGDVLLEFKLWEGITKKQLEEIRKSKKKHIWIKEGVRFTPTFLLAILFTIFVGEGFIWVLNLFG